ncbi:MAG TPA: hypothetical protein VKA09_16185 [Nitrososphaeraceae archaeon]|jgi:hypothetical protein|nr:hypothetical protein [Nitrososphaeraceae archaeon]
MSDNEKEELDEAQNDQDEVGEAGSDPETSGPAENLREKAAKTTDKGQDSEEPA